MKNKGVYSVYGCVRDFLVCDYVYCIDFINKMVFNNVVLINYDCFIFMYSFVKFMIFYIYFDISYLGVVYYLRFRFLFFY